LPFPGYNVRSTEINAVIGRSQLKRLDQNNKLRTENLRLFLDHLDSDKYQTDFAVGGSCNYALTLVLKKANPVFCERVMSTLRELRRRVSSWDIRRRQSAPPTLCERNSWAIRNSKNIRQVNHVHFYGFYIGNYPGLEKRKNFAALQSA
jgi:CDP-6-deoxy-D-xylo-4-hexulose-3-dehydrase